MQTGTYVDKKDRRIMKEDGFGGGKVRSFILFDGTIVSEGGWCGQRWMNCKELLSAEDRWVNHSYNTRADKLGIKDIPPEFNAEQLKEFDRVYDLTDGCAQCGGCRWFAAFDADYGVCCNNKSPNDGRVVFEHGGCIYHSFICEKLNV